MSAPTLPLVLEDYIRQIQSIKARGLSRAAEVSPQSLSARPAPDAWSPLEILDHLRVSVEQYLIALDKAMGSAAPSVQKDREPHYSWVWRWFVKSLEPPVKRKFRAPKAFMPGNELDVEATLRGFAKAHDELIARIEKAALFDLERVKVVSPGNPLLKLPLGCAFLTMAAHGRRHLWQLEQLARPELTGERG